MREICLAVLLALAACDAGSTDSDPPDNMLPDAAASGPQNGLGQTCTTAGECPSEPLHECVFLQSGNPNLGYCSPVCTTDADCANGFSGPGTASCFVPNQSNVCSITCTGACPGELVCADLGGGAIQICVTQ